jgi:carotenoid 1,2-hydratase
LDGVSEDGSTAIVIIALLGSPFSPRYARERAAGGPARALDFCAMNVAVYGPRGRLWALTEQRIDDVDREASALSLGRSTMRWEGDKLVVDLDELTSPFPRAVPQRVKGRVTFRPGGVGQAACPLDDAGLHTWWPVAPMGRIEVDLSEPGVRFTGHGYHDANAGDTPLESAFSRWSWCRARVDDDRAAITYDVVDRRGRERSLALEISRADGGVARVEPVPTASLEPLPATLWRLPRSARTEGAAPRVHRELEDGPFYARTLVETRLGGRSIVAMHETMSLDRLAQGWVRFLLGFKIGRS